MYESDSQSDQSALIERVLGLLGSGRAGVITDVDGTIAPIVTNPADAYVLPAAREALDVLKQQIALVAVVSGRQVADVRAMVGVDGISYVGNHGLEMLTATGPQVVPEARPWVPRLAQVIHEIEQRVTTPGVKIENKGVTASLHYRTTANPEQARRELLEIVARTALTSGLRLEEGRMVLNLLPPLTVSKGSAVSWLAREHQLDALVYLGDDVTDAHAFRALKNMRETSPMRTLSIGVIGPETPVHVRQLADLEVASVQEVADLLCTITNALRAGGTMNSGAATVRRESA